MEKDRRGEKEMKQSQIETDMVDTSRRLSHTPKSACKQKRATSLSKKDSLLDMERAGASPNDPLLYAFRKARKYSPTKVPSVVLGVPKYESLLLPSDSGFGSLMSQEVSPEKVPSGGAGAFLPITKRVSPFFSDGSQHPEHDSQDPQSVSEHPDDMTTQHPHHSTKLAQRTDQYLQHMSQHPQQISQRSLLISQYGHRISKHPWHMFKHSQQITQHLQHTAQRPEQISQQSRHVSPHPAALISDAHVEPCELGSVLDEGEPHWRQSLHKLISLHGFRSKKAARQAASLCAQPLRLQARIGTGTQTFPRLHWQGALGERVTQGMEMTGTYKEPSPTKFQHELPLPWRLGHLPLNPRGQVKYGKLEMDWVRTDDTVLCQTGKISLPKINPKGSLIQA